jgi:hypothetical protein
MPGSWYLKKLLLILDCVGGNSFNYLNITLEYFADFLAVCNTRSAQVRLKDFLYRVRNNPSIRIFASRFQMNQTQLNLKAKARTRTRVSKQQVKHNNGLTNLLRKSFTTFHSPELAFLITKSRHFVGSALFSGVLLYEIGKIMDMHLATSYWYLYGRELLALTKNEPC